MVSLSNLTFRLLREQHLKDKAMKIFKDKLFYCALGMLIITIYASSIIKDQGKDIIRLKAQVAEYKYFLDKSNINFRSRFDE